MKKSKAMWGKIPWNKRIRGIISGLRLSQIHLEANNPTTISATIYPYMASLGVLSEEEVEEHRGKSFQFIVDMSGDDFILDVMQHFLSDCPMASLDMRIRLLRLFLIVLFPEFPFEDDRLSLLTVIRNLLFNDFQNKPRIIKSGVKK